MTFTVVPDEESGGPFDFTWLLDGAPIGGSSSCLHLFTSPYDPPQRRVTVEISTRGGPPASLVWNLNVREEEGNAPPVVLSTTPEGDVTVLSSEEVLLAVMAADRDSTSPLTYRWTVDGEALSERSAKITLAGSELGSGDHEAEVTVSDKQGATAAEKVQWKIHVTGSSGNRPPLVSAVTPPGPVRIANGTSLRLKVEASDPEGEAVGYRWEVDGVAQGESGPVLQFVPDGVRTYSIKATALDQGEPGEPSSYEWKVESATVGAPAAEPPDLRMAWDPVDTDLEGRRESLSGYLLYISRKPDDYGDPMELGQATEARIYHLSSGATYYVNVSAYDVDGNESGFSSPVSFVAP